MNLKYPTTLTTMYIRYLATTKEYQVPGIKKEKRRKEEKKRKKNRKMRENKHALREQAESSGDKVAVCWWYGQSYDVSSWWATEGRQKRPDGRQAKMRAETTEKNKSRPQRGGGFSLNLDLPGVLRWSGVCDIAWYIAIYRDIMPRIMRYHKIRHIEISYHIYIPNFWDWYGDIVSRRFISRYRLLSFCQLGAPGLVHQESTRNGY